MSNTKPNMIKKAKASKLKEQRYVYVPQPKVDHQAGKISLTEFRWIGPYLVEKALPKNFGSTICNERNPSPSSHETTSIYTQTTHTRRTNNITRMET